MPSGHLVLSSLFTPLYVSWAGNIMTIMRALN